MLPGENWNTSLPRPLNWRFIAQGKHSRVYDCGNGWVFKESVSPEQADVIRALGLLPRFLEDDGRVPEIHLSSDGYFQQRVDGLEPCTHEIMRLAYRLNLRARSCELYFHDLAHGNVVVSEGTYWILDALCRPRRR